MAQKKTLNILVTWRHKQLNVEVDSESKLKDFGLKLQQLTKVKPDTIRFFVPQFKGSKLIAPFSDDYSNLSLQDVSIVEGMVIKMMGVFDEEIVEVSRSSSKADLRIAGFDEEEKRMKQRSSNGPQASLQLPKGPYIFCDFRTLHLPGIELEPPAFEALKRMHMLACDPGIIAIMNKHRWTIGIMTEMAPVGYVGISPKCLLGFNKNQGEEISLRLRTDDLKGFRKYDTIKKTLLHELAHMVYSEHDSNFYALDKQLNLEAASLDWTKSASHTLNGHNIHKYSDHQIKSHYKEYYSSETSSSNGGQKLGGAPRPLVTARASSISAAYSRFMNTSRHLEVNNVIRMGKAGMDVEDPNRDECMDNASIFEPDPDDSNVAERIFEPDPDELNDVEFEKPDPDDSCGEAAEAKKTDSNSDSSHGVEVLGIEGFRTMEDPVASMSLRFERAVKLLRSEAPSAEADSTLQTLLKIVRNVLDHPNDMKFRKLRKANPHFQRNIANHKAAVEFLALVGFRENVIPDGAGGEDTYLVLGRNDPVLLWLAKSSLEQTTAIVNPS